MLNHREIEGRIKMKKMVKLEDIITLEKMAEEIGVSRDTIDRWAEKGMPVIKIDKFVRVFRPHVYEWMVTHGEIMNSENYELLRWNKENKAS
jgi:DNA-binding XRE family transcriptional regulator